METSVSIIVAIPIHAEMVECANLAQLTHKDTHAAVAPTIMDINARIITTAILFHAKTMDGARLIQIAHKDTRAAVGMDIMDIDVST